jgi:hypothetical protein
MEDLASYWFTPLYIVSITLSLPGLRVALLIFYPWESVEDLSFGLLLEWD